MKAELPRLPDSPLEPLINALIGEHEVIDRVLDAVDRELQRLAAQHPVDPIFWRGAADFFRVFADQCHHAKEEQRLFPALIELGLPAHNGPIPCLQDEHEFGRILVRRIEDALDEPSSEPLIAAASRLVGLLREHIEKENQVLFPLANRLQAGASLPAGPLSACSPVDGVDGDELHRRYLELADRLCQDQVDPAARRWTISSTDLRGRVKEDQP